MEYSDNEHNDVDESLAQGTVEIFCLPISPLCLSTLLRLSIPSSHSSAPYARVSLSILMPSTLSVLACSPHHVCLPHSSVSPMIVYPLSRRVLFEEFCDPSALPDHSSIRDFVAGKDGVTVSDVHVRDASVRSF